MANFFTRALDRVTPWNRGGELVRRKKREEEQAQQQQSQPQNTNRNTGGLSVRPIQNNQRVVVDQPQQPKPQQPQNIFETLNKGLVFNKPQTAVPILASQDTKPAEPVRPGQVIRPTVKVTNSMDNRGITLPDGRNTRDIPDSPETVINRALDRGESFEDIARKNNYRLEGVKEYANATRPDYGIKIERPKQSIGNKFRDVFDTNTEADKFRRQEGNKVAIQQGRPNEVKNLTLEKQGNIVSRTPIVGHITKTLNTLGAQIPEVAITAEGAAYTKINSDLTKQMMEAQKRGDRAAYEEAKRKLDLLAPLLEKNRREQDAAHTMFQKNDGGLFNAGTLYGEEGSKTGDAETALKDIALPTAVSMLDLYTLGLGNLATEGVQQAGLRKVLGEGVEITAKKGAKKVSKNIGKTVGKKELAKLVAGNYASGDLSARSEGATGLDPTKAGLINSILGLVPDVGLPTAWRGFTNRVVPKFLKGSKVAAKDVVEELDDAAISASAEAANQAMKPRPISVAKNIPVDGVEGLGEVINVRNLNEPAPLIQEVTGDATTATPNALIQKTADDIRETAARDAAFDQAKTAPKPNRAIEGVAPRSPEAPYRLDEKAVTTAQDKMIDEYAAWLREMGEGNGTQLIPNGEGGYYRTSNNVRPKSFGSKKATKGMWRDEAERQLRNGEAEPGLQKAFDETADPELQSMLTKGEQPEAPVGTPIKVQQATGIPVRDEINVPQNLPETPGQVRVTNSTAPTNTKSQTVAETQQVYTEALESRIPVVADTASEYILSNPKQFTKRQVASARNQRKLARQMAKTQEDTAEAMQRIEASKTNPGAGQREGYAPTGEYVTGRHGNVSEKATNVTEADAGAREMENRSVDDLLDEIASKESFTPGDRRRITAAKENLMRSDPEGFRASERYKILDNLEKASRSELGRGLALIPRTIRKISNSDTITARWERKVGNVLDDPSKMTNEQFATVQKANDAFTQARDRAGALEEQFRKTGSEADFKAWEQAYKAASDADTAAKMTEVKVAQQILKGEKGANVTKTIDALKKEADVNTMDFVTANMLSGTGTGFRNTFGTELAGIENRVGANLRAKVVKGIFGENVGGFDRKGARFGRKLGVGKWFGDAGRRASQGGKNPIEWSKNWATTINSGGESSLQSQVYSRLAKYYKNQFTDAGLSGKDLDLRMRHAMITDPDNMGDIYLDATMRSSGLTGMFEKGQTIEKAVTDYVGRHVDNKYAQGASKLVMRMLVGFPTATANFLYQSSKRMLLGTPSYIEAGLKAAQGDKMAAAMAFDRGMKETGSGAAMYGFGAMMGAAGLISGPYPSDPEERARWEREGISENSMKIGGAWYPIPQGAGMFGLPIMLGAAIGREGDSNESVKEMFTPKNLSKLLPTDQIQGALNTLTGDESPQAMKNMLASSVRAVTPVGALLNQISKSFDSTKNDTTTKDFWNNTLDQIYSGIPGVNNMANIPDKLDDAGNSIQNPNPLQLGFGATSAVQGGGEQRSAEIDAKVKSALDQIDQYGLLSDPNLEGVLEGSGLEAYTKATQNRKLDESDIKALKEGMVKGVSSEGTDTAYLEKGQYDTNLAVLKMKRDLMNEDKTTKPSSLKDIDNAIKRGEVYKKDQVPYELISELKSIGVEDWRKMGIGPEDEDYDEDFYDPEMYQKLWDLDRKLTEAGVSLGKNLDKPKYFVKKKKTGSGSGGKGSRQIDTSFGTLGNLSFAPKTQEYAGIDAQSGSIPIIRTVRPNIVHKISSSR